MQRRNDCGDLGPMLSLWRAKVAATERASHILRIQSERYRTQASSPRGEAGTKPEANRAPREPKG